MGITAIINVVLNVLLIPVFGINGAAAAMLGTMLVNAFLAYANNTFVSQNGLGFMAARGSKRARRHKPRIEYLVRKQREDFEHRIAVARCSEPKRADSPQSSCGVLNYHPEYRFHLYMPHAGAEYFDAAGLQFVKRSGNRHFCHAPLVGRSPICHETMKRACQRIFQTIEPSLGRYVSSPCHNGKILVAQYARDDFSGCVSGRIRDCRVQFGKFLLG